VLGFRAARWAVAPSAALVGRLRYAHKFAIVGLVLVLPLAVVAGAYVKVQRNQIAFSARERHGVACLDPLTALAAGLISGRHAAARGAAPGPGLARLLAAADAADRRHGAILGISGAWARTRALTETARTGSGTPFERVARYDRAMEGLLALIVQVGDASNLTLDPDLDTYYLMDTVQFRLPVVLDAAARVSDVATLGAGSRRGGGASSEELIQLGIARGVLSSSQDALGHDLATVVATTADDSVRTAVRTDSRDLTSALQEYSRALDRAVSSGRAGPLRGAGITRLEDVVQRTATDSASALDHLLQRRIERLSHGAKRVVAGTVLSTVVAIYLFLGFYVSVMTSMRRIVASLRAVAAGDLTQHVEVDTRDELHFVADVLNETVSRTREATDLLTQQATLDALTGLPNRVLVLRELEAARQSGRPGWVLFIDLDRFKLVNDSFGHECGDEVLAEVAYRVHALAQDRAVAGRLAGDEFVLIVTEPADEAGVRHLGMLVVHRLTEQIRLGSGRRVAIGASVGIAAVTGDADAEELLRRADLAMYEAKKAGRGRVELYDEELAAVAEGRLLIRTELQEALDTAGLLVHYQPIVNVAAGRLAGLEALARWDHPSRGLLHPADFIDIAEESGLILPLGSAMLVSACRQLVAWQTAHPGAAEVYMSVNVSPAQLISPDYVAAVAGVLAETGLRPHCLCLEITETTIMADTRRSQAVLEGLRSLGVRLAIDDFGVGYSSLAYLSRFPVQTLKVDKSFVSGMLRDHHDAAIVSMLISLAGNLALDVIAEGVETAGQRDQLSLLGYSTMQGYLFGRPAPFESAWSPAWLGPALDHAVSR
jgi:diguanylate cyclase (GGDEF)-like protein